MTSAVNPSLPDLHRQHGAHLAADGIPLHYNDLQAEYAAAQTAAVLLDRSHEGRVRLTGGTRFDLLNRMSTNKMIDMAAKAGRPTIFTNANGRILDRIEAYPADDSLLILTQPGRGPAVAQFLQRNIFFGDDAQPGDITAQTAQFALHGPQAASVLADWLPDAREMPVYGLRPVEIDGVPVQVMRRKPLTGDHFTLVIPQAEGAKVYSALLQAGSAAGLIPAGSLTYNTLRIRAGVPAGRELSADYIPLEVGLFDEISFDKGCYTGQEIIARMESRGRQAKVLVRLALTDYVEAPAPITAGDTAAGTLTSSVQAPDGSVFGLAVIKTSIAQPDAALTVGAERISVHIRDFAGTPPPYLVSE